MSLTFEDATSENAFFVQFVPNQMNEEELKEYFDDEQVVKMNQVLFRAVKNKPFKNAIVFTDEPRLFFDASKEIEYKNRTYVIKVSGYRELNRDPVTIEIKNVHFDAPDEEIDNYFGITNYVKIYNSNGQSTGTILFNAENFSVAFDFIRQFNQSTFLNRQVHVDFYDNMRKRKTNYKKVTRRY